MADISIPLGSVVVNASSGNVAAAVATATMAAPPSGANYVTALAITGAGATAPSVVVATLTGIVGGPFSYILAVPTGATAGMTPIFRQFPFPLKGIDGTAITLSMPSLGVGNTNAAVNLSGFRL